LSGAREKAGIRLSDIDYVVLVGGSSKVPLVRDTVRAAFCNPDLPEHARSPQPLLHEPDLCVAFGAALRAATHGTRYLFSGVGLPSEELVLHLTSPVNVQEAVYQLTGVVRGPVEVCDAGSVRIHAFASGLTDEAFLDDRGTFAHDLELQPDTDNALALAP